MPKDSNTVEGLEGVVNISFRFDQNWDLSLSRKDQASDAWCKDSYKGKKIAKILE